MSDKPEKIYEIPDWYRKRTIPKLLVEEKEAKMGELEKAIEHLQGVMHEEDLNIECFYLAIQALREKLERDSDGWIKCSEKIPESGTRVLLCCKQRENDKRYSLNGFWTKANTVTFEHSGGSLPSRNEEEAIFLPEGFYQIVFNCVAVKITDTITHWRPMPSLPKEKP